MNTNHSNVPYLLSEAESLGENALVDPVPEMSNPESLPHRAETMRAYFVTRVEDLVEKFNALPKDTQDGLSGSQMRELLVDSMEKGFSTLVLDQPSLQDEQAPHHDLSHDPSEMLKFTKEVFQTIRDPRMPYPEQQQFTGGKIDYRLHQKE